MTQTELDTAISDATTRKTEAQSLQQALMKQAMDLNQQGVDVEKTILGIDGELKALASLSDKVRD